MKRFVSVTLAAALVAAWLAPNSAEAGPLRRLFWRLNSAPVARTTVVQENGYRRYSYEPGTVETVAPSTERRAAVTPTWMLPKSHPGRYDAR